MGKFRCGNCSYILSVEGGKIPRLCPNCGEDRSLEKERDADELLDEL